MDVVQLWESCLRRLADRMSDQHFQTWIQPIEALRFSEENGSPELTLGAPSPFHARWVQDNFERFLLETTTDVVGQPVQIGYEIIEPEGGREKAPPDRPRTPQSRQRELFAGYVTAQPQGDRRSLPRPEEPSLDEASRQRSGRQRSGEQRGADAEAAMAPPRAPERDVSEAQVERYAGTRINERYTFDNFIQGDCNQLASHAALAIADAPSGGHYNPFFVYGGVGLGKTHLVQAIGNRVLASKQQQRVHYVSSDSFTSQFVAAIQNNRMADFSGFYRAVDVLIVDDIQFFGDKEKTQEEFFHIFNDLYQRGKQIILCADRSPQEIQEVEDRLLSRFRAGLSADMQPPDYETRAAILQHKAENQNLTLAPDVVAFLARSITKNIRDLEGAINKLQIFSETTNTTIDVPVARQILTDFVDGTPTSLNIEDIQKRVASHFDVTVEELLSSSRKREISNARQIAMFFCRRLTSRTHKSIGMRFGGRDHSTVIHACKRVEDMRETDPAYDQRVEDMRQKLQVPA